MKIYTISVNGKLETVAYTSLKSACRNAGVKYFSAIRGKRTFAKSSDKIVITDINVVKIKRVKR